MKSESLPPAEGFSFSPIQMPTPTKSPRRRAARSVRGARVRSNVEPKVNVGTKRGRRIRQPKRRGEWAELIFAARAAAHGFIVTKPWGDSAPYDFILEKNRRFVRVQVKSTYYRRGRNTGYMCMVRGSIAAGPYKAGDFEFLAAYVIPKDLWFIIPINEILGKKAVFLGSAKPRMSRIETCREAWHLLEYRMAGRNRGTTRKKKRRPSGRRYKFMK